MKFLLLSGLLIALPLFAAAAPQNATPAPNGITAALADPARPEADRARDAARKPAELIAFARIKPDQHVLDFVMGGGYWTHVVASVVGPKGLVYAFQPTEFVAYRAAYATEQDAVAKARANVRPVRSAFAAPAITRPVDAIITVQNYHDLHLAPFPKDTASNAGAALFAALKPGGTLVVVDHAGAPGSGLDAADKLHRIDPAIVRRELESAGFVFDGELATWRDATDSHTINVFDPAIRGKTDQFAYRFRKPT